jgi:hypothetical protein
VLNLWVQARRAVDPEQIRLARQVSQVHEMVLNGHVESGAEDWSCPRCGRRELLRWPPRYERLIVEPGDPKATHIGGNGGVRVSGMCAATPPVTGLSAAERRWLRDNGIAWS